MKTPFIVFTGSALLSAALQLATVSCAEDSYAEECRGAVWPRLPDDQGPATIDFARNSDGTIRGGALPFELTGGTVTIANQQVLISYKVDGSERDVVYDIQPRE